MTKLTIDEILEPLKDLRCVHCGRQSFVVQLDDAKAQLLQLLSDSMDSLIGEDEENTSKEAWARNELRKDLRQRKILIMERYGQS